MRQVATETELQAAIAASDPEIVVMANLTLDAMHTISYTATIQSSEGGSYTLSKGDALTVPLFTVSNGGSLTLSNIILDGVKQNHPSTQVASALVNIPQGTLVLDSGAILQNNKALNGGAISTNGESNSISIVIKENAILRNNEAIYDGGAIYARTLEPGVSIQISGMAQFENNKSARNGGAIFYTCPQDTLSISGNAVFTGNTAESGGGAIYIGQGGCTVTDAVAISNNQANSGGGLAFSGNNLQLTGTAISNNRSQSYGGAIALTGDALNATLNNVKLIGNIATTGGGALSSENATGSIATSNNSQITANHAATGGGIYHDDKTVLSISDTRISQNIATTSGYNIYNAGPLELGGTVAMPNGLYFENQENIPTIVQHLTAGSVVQLEPSSYLTPNPAGTPIVVAQSSLALTSADAAAFLAPTTGFDGWGARLSADAHQVVLAPVIYTIQYENTMGAKNPNPSSYTVLTPTITLSPLTNTSGYHFAGWFDALEGGTQVTEIPLGSTGDKTLYAHWQAAVYTITYYGNDASGPKAHCVPCPQQTFASQYVQLSCQAPNRACYCFAGWNTAPDGTGQMYHPGQILEQVTENLNLYALWKKIPPCPPPCNNGCIL